jgi:hypothetical protein
LTKALEALRAGAMLAVFLLFMGFGIGSTRPMPKNALVLLDDEKRQYLSPPCVADRSELRPAFASQAYELHYAPAQRCGDFAMDGRSLSGSFLERVGVLSPLPSRWRADGSWKW